MTLRTSPTLRAYLYWQGSSFRRLPVGTLGVLEEDLSPAGNAFTCLFLRLFCCRREVYTCDTLSSSGRFPKVTVVVVMVVVSLYECVLHIGAGSAVLTVSVAGISLPRYIAVEP